MKSFLLNIKVLISFLILQSVDVIDGKCFIDKQSVNCFGSTWQQDLFPIENDSLQKLNISKCSNSNKDAGSIDMGFLKFLPKLKILSITDCELRRPPTIQDHINSVESVDLSNNLIDEKSKDDVLGMNFFKNLPNLKILNLSRNRLKDLPKVWFEYPNHVEELILDDNLITGLDPSLASSFTHLKRLSLRNNKFSFLRKKTDSTAYGKVIDNPSGLDMSENIDRIQPQTFGNIRHKTSKGNTNQKSFVSIIPDFPSLTILDLSFNQIQSLDQIPFMDLENLSKLILRGNKLSSNSDNKHKDKCDFGTAPFYIKGNLGLYHIDLSDNIGITRIQSCWTFGLKNLQTLELSNCSLNFIYETAFEKMKNITKLNLSRNQFNEVPKELTMISNTLIDMDMSYNNISQLRAGHLLKMEKLKILNLSHNLFQNLLTFSSLESDSKAQEISNVQASGDIPETDESIGLLSRMHFLQDLDLSFNNLSKISATSDLPPSSKVNGKMWRIKLDGNPQLTQLVNFNYEIITETLDRFSISEQSKLICNCQLSGFIRWIIHRQIEISARCGSPKNLKGQFLTSETVVDFVMNKKNCSEVSPSKEVKPIYKLKLFSNANRTTNLAVEGGPMNGNTRKVLPNQKRQSDHQKWAMIESNVTFRCEFYSSHQRYFEPVIRWQRIKAESYNNEQNKLVLFHLLKAENYDKNDFSKYHEKTDLNPQYDIRIKSFQIGPLDEKLNLDKLGFSVKSDLLQNLTIPFSGKPYKFVSYLTLHPIYTYDYGRYRCLVNELPVNQFYGQTQLASNEEEIKVFTPPKFTSTPSHHMSIIEGETAEITCRATGYPVPMTSLSRIGSKDFPAARGRRMVIYKDDSSFFITRVRQIDAGNYSCTSRNAAGTISHNFTLKVQTPATFLELAPTKIIILIGQPLVIRYKINGVPSPHIKWFKDGHTLTENDRLSFSADQLLLVVQSSVTQDAGIYNISIHNALGGSEASVSVQIFDNCSVMNNKPSIHTPINSGPNAPKEPNWISDYWLSAIIIIVVLSILLTSILWITIFLCFGKLIGSKKRRLLLISNSQSKSSFDKAMTSTSNFVNSRGLHSNVCHIPLSLTTSTIVRHDQSREECHETADSEIISENMKTCSEFYSPQISRNCFPEMQSTYSINNNRIFHSQPYLTTSKLDLSNGLSRLPSGNHYKTILKNEPCDSGIDSSHIYSETLNSSDISSIYKCRHKSKHKSNNPKRKRHQNPNPTDSSEAMKSTTEIMKSFNTSDGSDKEKNAQTSCKDYLFKQSKSKKPCNSGKGCPSTPLIT